jgi:hypothetical protein
MAADQVDLAALDDNVSFLELDAVVANGLDLPPLQHDAGLVLFLDEVVVKSFFVLCDAHVNTIWLKIVILL